MNGHDYIKRTDQGLLEQATPMSAQITLTPTAFGVTASDATFLAGKLTAYSNALALAKDPTTRTKVTVRGKNTAKAALVDAIRGIVRRIQVCPTVTDAQRESLSIPVHDHFPTPVPPPATRPVLTHRYSRGMVQTMRVQDETTPASRAKPGGVIAAEVRAFFGETPAGEKATWPTVCIATRADFEFTVVEAEAGQLATVVARWVNDKGQYGPFSDAVTLRIGGSLAKAA